MKTISATLCSLAVLVAPASAAPRHCSTGKCFKQPVVVKQQVVKELVPVVQQQNVVHYFVGAPAGLAYQPLQQAHYGQLQRQMQRLMDRFADLGELQQQQMAYAPWQPQQAYAAPQYVQPQQQPQCGSCHGNGQAPPLQQQQQMQVCEQRGGHCPKPTHLGPESTDKEIHPSSGSYESVPEPQRPAFSMQHGPGIVAAKCAKCHNDDKASGDLSFEQPLTFEQKFKSLAKAANGEMPKGGDALTPDEVRQLADEILTEAEAEQLSAVLNPLAQ